MTKIAFIGAGSYGFTRRLVGDLLTYESLQDVDLAFMLKSDTLTQKSLAPRGWN